MIKELTLKQAIALCLELWEWCAQTGGHKKRVAKVGKV